MRTYTLVMGNPPKLGNSKWTDNGDATRCTAVIYLAITYYPEWGHPWKSNKEDGFPSVGFTPLSSMCTLRVCPALKRIDIKILTSGIIRKYSAIPSLLGKHVICDCQPSDVSNQYNARDDYTEKPTCTTFFLSFTLKKPCWRVRIRHATRDYELPSLTY
ncbi:hypothetical protein K445DRAFT_233531 [Daldinia sp. EC12]|nr:hypothetical protein K445DRAFT_233531 [Daldinia sp. EC12]